MNKIYIKRAYDEADKKDGYRILVDRLWPRGIKKEDLKYEEWIKDIAPSTDLRKSFNHEEDRFSDFKKEYVKELNNNDIKEEWLEKIKDKLKEDAVTFIYSAKDTEDNNAVVLKEWTEKKLK